VLCDKCGSRLSNSAKCRLCGHDNTALFWKTVNVEEVIDRLQTEEEARQMRAAINLTGVLSPVIKIGLTVGEIKSKSPKKKRFWQKDQSVE